MNKSDIAFTKDIIEKTAKDLGLTNQTVENVYEFCVKYLYEITEMTDCCTFDLPYIGMLYIKEDHVDKTLHDKIAELKKDPENELLQKQKNALELKYKKLRSYLVESGKPNSYSYHYLMERPKKQNFNRRKTIEEMQEIQNQLYEKHHDKDSFD